MSAVYQLKVSSPISRENLYLGTYPFRVCVACFWACRSDSANESVVVLPKRNYILGCDNPFGSVKLSVNDWLNYWN